MSDEPAEESTALVQSDNEKREYKDYSLEDKYVALAALDLMAGNVYRTSKAYDIPYSTLYRWNEERKARGGALTKIEKEKRGDLATKAESVAHSIIESMPGKIAKATLSQAGVAFGIVVDKVRILRGQGLDPDPATELCRLLNINRAQLPSNLQLEPGEPIPEGFGPVIETQPSPDNPNSYEPTEPEKPEAQALMDEPDDDKPAN